VTTQSLRKARAEGRTARPLARRQLVPLHKTEAPIALEGSGLTRSDPGLRDQQSRTGILMLSSSLELIHMDPWANSLSRRLDAQSGYAAHGALPLQVVELCAAVRRHGNFQVQAVTTKRAQHAIILFGFEIPDSDGAPPRILILLRETRWHEWPLHLAVERFGLTPREETVIRHLVMGYTNKEIANALCIAEQTVKEHMKHLMLKTSASTRTGLLARVLTSGPRTLEDMTSKRVVEK
jgi:DNA-binding CsgD family transcriptional regulator